MLVINNAKPQQYRNADSISNNSLKYVVCIMDGFFNNVHKTIIILNDA